jgi:hypothetical protein
MPSRNLFRLGLYCSNKGLWEQKKARNGDAEKGYMKIRQAGAECDRPFKLSLA